MPSTLIEYLNGLDAPRQQAFAQLADAVARAVEGVPSALAELVFVAGARSHPVFADHQEVFWMAACQLLLGPGVLPQALPGELPLVFIGYFGKVRLTRRSYAQGFLLTDARVAAQDEFALSKEQPPVRMTWIDSGPGRSAADSTDLAWASFDKAPLTTLVGAGSVERVHGLLNAAATAVQQQSLQIGHRAPVPPAPVVGLRVQAQSHFAPATDLPGRVRELGLTSSVTLPGNPKADKHLAKLAKAVHMPAGERALFSISDATIAGVYGVLVTDRAVRSRDLLEEAVATPRAEVAGVQLVEKDGLLLAPGQRHTLPSSLSERERAAIATVLIEFLVPK